MWTSLQHDDTVTAARVWTCYEEPFLNQIGTSIHASSSSSSSGGGSSSGAGKIGTSTSTSIGTGTSTGAGASLPLGAGGFTLDILKKLATSSTLTTSSTDRSVILWLFAAAVSNTNTGASAANHASSGSGVTRFLQPVPARRFHFSSIPTRALCFHSSLSDYRRLNLLTYTNSMLQELAEADWQLSVLVDGRLVTAAKAQKQWLLKPSMPPSRVVAAGTQASISRKMGLHAVAGAGTGAGTGRVGFHPDGSASSTSEDGHDHGHGHGHDHGHGHGHGPDENGQNHLAFIPVVSPVLSALHASDVMARRDAKFTVGSLALLDEWAIPRGRETGVQGILGGNLLVTDKWLAVGNSGNTHQRPRSPGQPDVVMVRVQDKSSHIDIPSFEAHMSKRALKKAADDANRALTHPTLTDQRAHVILDGFRLRAPQPMAGMGMGFVEGSMGIANALQVRAWLWSFVCWLVVSCFLFVCCLFVSQFVAIRCCDPHAALFRTVTCDLHPSLFDCVSHIHVVPRCLLCLTHN